MIKKVMIVDDEEIIIKGLYKIIDWNDLGMEIVCSAFSGEEAYTLACNNKPDIIITDIKMYDVSGLDFGEKYLKINPNCKIIALSGYLEFKYAQRAINSGFFGFLSKPLDKKEFIEILKSASISIDKDRIREKTICYYSHSLRHEANYLSSCLIGDDLGNDDLENIKKYFPIYLDFNIGDDHDWIMESLVAEISESNNEGIFVLRQGGIAGIIIDRDGNVDIRKITNNIYQRLNKSIPLLTIGIGNSVNYPSEIRRGYHNAKSLTKNSFFNNNYIVEEESPRNYEVKYISIENADQELLNTLSFGIQENINDVIINYLNWTLNKSNFDKECFFDIVSDFLMKLTVALNNENDRILEIDSFFKKMRTYKKYILFKNDFIEFLTVVFSKIRDINKMKNADLIEAAKAYIDKNYQEQLTIEAISNKIYLTPTYFCYLFKQKTGIGYHEYLFKKRMKEAIKLVASGNYKVYEIADRVGYVNPRYFSEVFKKYYGILPTEFDIKIHKDLLDKE